MVLQSLQMKSTMVLPGPASIWIAIQAIHYAYPAVTFFYFLVAITITVCMLQTQALRVQDSEVRRDVMLALIFVVAGTYLLESIAVLVEALFDSNGWHPAQDRVVYLISSLIVFGVQAIALTDAKFPVWYPYYGTWFIGICVELTLLILPNVYSPPNATFDYVVIATQCFRVVTLLLLVSLFFGPRSDKKEYDNADAEQQSLLKNGKPGGSEDSAKGYGTASGTTTSAISVAASEDSWVAKQRKAQELIEKRLQQDGNWFTYAKGFAVFFPHIWPMHRKGLQARAVLVGVCLLVTNALNVLVPNQMGVMIDSLTKYNDGDHSRNIWLPVAIYITFRFLNSGACIGWIQKWLWMPVEQYSYQALSTASHAHIMTLSSDFHDSKTSSDLIQAVQGGRSVADLLETVCFQVVPMFIDLAIAFGYLWSIFGPYMGLLMAATASTYLYVTTKLITRRADKRRNYIAMMRKEWTVGYASLDGWTTASMFNMINYEQDKYAGAVTDHLGTKYQYEMAYQSTSAAQGLIMTIGLLGALWLGVYQVAFGDLSVGRFTTLLVYWAQLSGPLTFFSSMFKNISYSLMDAEKLLDLFQTKPTIKDSPTATALKLDKGEVEFDNVSFAYDERKPTLKNVSFTIPAGKTVALVGETGGGKSTILKLLDRFYDVSGGSIMIDNQDIRNVTLSSLRENIGIVPQDPTLFNMSIMENIRYSRLSATDEEVFEACKAAAVHDKIMTFPDGYESKVGNQGVKLSGGEKQRVAIARAILKQPEIILLDEATSAVDTETENLIQEGFRTLCRNRTTFIVAHRLSTIMKADHILVVMDGEIVEAGTHESLIRAQGKYHSLWSKQIFVKPSDERSRSRSPKKLIAAIVNDLSPSKQKAELAKVPKADEQAADGETKKGEEKPKDSSHQREGSKLKADAPEFIPSFARAGGFSKETVKAQKKLEKEEKKAASLREKEQRKAASILEKEEKKAAKKARFGNSEIISETESSAAGRSAEQPNNVGEPTPIKPKWRRSRSSRRIASKSEPNRVHETHDGAQDYEAAIGSGDSQALVQGFSTQLRRVSAPSDPPTGLQNPRNSRARRVRNWKVRNQPEDSGSTLGSTLGSYDTSTDDTALPVAPTTSPAAGASQDSGAMGFTSGS